MDANNEIILEGVLTKGYGIMPKMIVLDKNLSIEAKAIYAFLTSFGGNGNAPFPSVETIIKYLSISENRFYKYRKELINNGYIEVKPRYDKNKRISNIYILNMQKIVYIQNKGIQNKDSQNGGSNNNNINNNNINNNIYIYWNEQKIIVHKELTNDLKKAIEQILKKFTEKEIIRAIEVYKEVLDSKYYFNYKWSLKDFLTRKNGVSTFMEDGSNYVNYKEWKEKEGKYDKNSGRISDGIKASPNANKPGENRAVELTPEERAAAEQLK